MRSTTDIANLLDELDHTIADALEDQDLDFKQWDTQSRDKAIRKVVHMAVCMANGGGGTVVFGVADHLQGRSSAVLGVPPEIDINILKKAVYDQTDPKIMPVFAELAVPEGTGRLLIMQIHPGMPPYTDSQGRGSIRIGTDCQPLTGTLRRKISVETGETDFTAEPIGPFQAALFSASALEALRDMAKAERAPTDLLNLSDKGLLNALGLIRNDKVTRAAILIGGTESAIRDHIPGHNWTFLQMTGDTGYRIREDGITALAASVKRIEQLLVPFNPITTVEQGLFHHEYHSWPPVAIREALMNAFCHCDFRLAGPVMVKLYPDRLDIGNNGGFIGGIRPNNILHHQPMARNPLLVEALTRLRLVNRTNLGISRMFSSLLMEGKEAPLIKESGESVTLTFFRRELNAAFRLFVADESRAGRDFDVDSLIILSYLLQHPELDIATAASLCQRTEPEARETLTRLEQYGHLEHGGTGRGSYWVMQPALYQQLTGDQGYSRRRIDWDAAKTRVLSILMERARKQETGLTNREIRSITKYDRSQVTRMMQEMRTAHPSLHSQGHGAGAQYVWQPTE